MGPAVMQRGLKVPQDLLLLGQVPELGEGRAAVHFKGTCRATPCVDEQGRKRVPSWIANAKGCSRAVSGPERQWG